MCVVWVCVRAFKNPNIQFGWLYLAKFYYKIALSTTCDLDAARFRACYY